jgi:hypothetical protein
MKKEIKKIIMYPSFFALICFVVLACSSEDNSSEEAETEVEADTEAESIITLSSAFDAFNSDAVTVTLSDDGTEIYIETTGYPDHTSIYWETDNELYIDEPTVTKTTQDTYIGGGTGEAASFTVDATPNLTGSTVDTELDTIGIAVSGASIFNDQEGGGDLDQAAGSLDYNGAHKGPGVYHYHLEPRSISYDDDALVGILLDGVFLYGRKCNSIGATPTDLDTSGGHTSITQYEDEAIYHYHIIDEEYNAPLYGYDEAIIAFAGPFQGY